MSLLEILPTNSLIKCAYGYGGKWRNGLIVSADKNKFIIDLETSSGTFTRFYIKYEKAMEWYYISKTLKLLSKVNNIPDSLFQVGTNIEFKYKNTRWKNGIITNISNPNQQYMFIKIKFKITVNDYQTMTMSRSKIVIDYHLYKTLKLSNMIYPNWIQLDAIVQINNINHKIICYRDGKSITFCKTSNHLSYQRLFTLMHSEFTKITNYYIASTTDIICKQINQISTSYTWKIPSLSYGHASVLCVGFVRIYSHTYVTTVIVQMIVRFFYTREGKRMLKKIKHGSHNQSFHTPILSIQSLKWQLQISRNLNVKVCLASMPMHISKLSVYLRLTLKKTNIEFINRIHHFDQDNLITTDGSRVIGRLNSIQHLKRLRFKLDMVVINIEYNNIDALESEDENIPQNNMNAGAYLHQTSFAQQENVTNLRNVMYLSMVLCIVSVVIAIKFGFVTTLVNLPS